MPEPSTQQLLESAMSRRQAGQLEEARSICRKILEAEPNHPDALHLTGVLTWELGNAAEAAAILQRAAAANPTRWNFHNTYGLVLQALGRKQEAISAWRRAVAARPNKPAPDALFNLANALQSAEQRQEAIATYRQLISVQPDYFAAHINLGNALQAEGQFPDSISAFRQATFLRADSADAWNNLGNALRASENFDDAIDAYQKAVALQPALISALVGLGISLWTKKRFNESVNAFQRAIALKPDDADIQHRFAGALRAACRFEEAIWAYERTLQLDPQQFEAHHNMSGALKDIGEVDAALRQLDLYIAARPDAFPAASHRLYVLHLHPDYDPDRVFAEHLQWNRRFAAPVRAEPKRHKNDRGPDRVLRIGYLSPDLFRHSVAFFLHNLLTGHDPAQVEIFCYANSRQNDDFTELLKNLSSQWRDIAGWDDERACDLIRQDKIDILVDLAGHTAGNRLLLFARKPAPIQATYLGYPDTTGVPEIDYRLTDAYADPPDQTEKWHTEQLLRLPDCFLCMGKMAGAPDITPLPGATAGQITFGSFNGLSKLNDKVLQLWARVLAAVPKSRLLLKSHSGLDNERPRRRIMKIFADAGIDPERIELHANLPNPKLHLEHYRNVDIGLDTYPYHGTTITCEALWMGIPTITLVGQAHVSRVGFSLLSNAGLSDLAAQTPEQYVQIAADLAADITRLSNIRSTLRDRLAQSPLTNPKQFAQNVEAAYREMWRRWRRK